MVGLKAILNAIIIYCYYFYTKKIFYMQNLESVPLIEIKKKLATQTERINFAREQGYFLPKMPGFDSKFFCQWLSGSKKISRIYNILNIIISSRFYWRI